MTATIITKNSSTASAVPTAGQIQQGELAVNVTDRKIFTKDAGGNVVVLAEPASAAEVTLTNSVTLTNKTMDFNSNTFLNFPAAAPFTSNEALAQVQAVALSF